MVERRLQLTECMNHQKHLCMLKIFTYISDLALRVPWSVFHSGPINQNIG